MTMIWSNIHMMYSYRLKKRQSNVTGKGKQEFCTGHPILTDMKAYIRKFLC